MSWWIWCWRSWILSYYCLLVPRPRCRCHGLFGCMVPHHHHPRSISIADLDLIEVWVPSRHFHQMIFLRHIASSSSRHFRHPSSHRSCIAHRHSRCLPHPTITMAGMSHSRSAERRSDKPTQRPLWPRGNIPLATCSSFLQILLTEVTAGVAL